MAGNKDKKNFNVVLMTPEIPQNTGNIGRLCVSTNTTLHLIKPLGFSLEDKYLKRAGMDYWKQLNPRIYDSWDDFLVSNPDAELMFFSTKADKFFWDCQYPDNAYLVFGSEGGGLPSEFYEKYHEYLYTIPMNGSFCRSFNLANSVAIALFEGLRQQYTTK